MTEQPMPARGNKHNGLNILLLVLAGLTLAGLIVLFALLQSEVIKSHQVDIAGRQRMLAQQLLMRAYEYADTGGAQNAEALRATAMAFQEGLNILSNGGLVRGHTVPPLPGSADHALETLRTVWRSTHTHIDALLAGNTDRRTAYKRIVANNDPLVAAADDVVAQLDDLAHRQHLIAVTSLDLSAAFAISVLIIGGLVLRRERAARGRAELTLRDKEERFRSVFEGAPVGITLADNDFRYIMVNPAFCQMLGYTAPELVGQKTLLDITHPDDREESARLMTSLYSDGNEAFTVEKRYLCKHGDIVWALVTVRALHDAEGKPIMTLCIHKDITERKQAEEHRLTSVREQRDALVREVHHRIKNHLQGLSGLLNQHTQEHPQLADTLKTVSGQIRSVAVVYGLEGKLPGGDVLLCEMVQAISQSVASFMGSKIETDTSSQFSQPIRITPQYAVAIALILNELFTNAIKHTGNEAVKVQLSASNGTGEVTVHNTNTRLPADFDFDNGRGLGTGLSLVRSLLPRRGAKLSFRDTGDGVEVRLVLQAPALSDEPIASMHSEFPLN